jgi:hypothetical protein
MTDNLLTETHQTTANHQFGTFRSTALESHLAQMNLTSHNKFQDFKLKPLCPVTLMI